MSNRNIIAAVGLPILIAIIVLGVRMNSAIDQLAQKVDQRALPESAAKGPSTKDVARLARQVESLQDQLDAVHAEMDSLRAELSLRTTSDPSKSSDGSDSEAVAKDDEAKAQAQAEVQKKAKGMRAWYQGALDKMGDVENGEAAPWVISEIEKELGTLLDDMGIPDQFRDGVVDALARNQKAGYELLVMLSDPAATTDEMMNAWTTAQQNLEGELAQSLNASQIQQLRDHYAQNSIRQREATVDDVLRTMVVRPEQEAPVREILLQRSADAPAEMRVLDKSDDQDPFRTVSREEWEAAHSLMSGDRDGARQLVDTSRTYNHATRELLAPHLTDAQSNWLEREIDLQADETQQWIDWSATGDK